MARRIRLARWLDLIDRFVQISVSPVSGRKTRIHLVNTSGTSMFYRPLHEGSHRRIANASKRQVGQQKARA
jgi:hypothetical protein